MTDQQLDDPLLRAVREARPAIDDAVVSPASAEALEVLERVLHDAFSTGGEASRNRRRFPWFRGISRPRLGAIATAAAAVVTAAVIVLSGISGGPSLVDRAYAAINAGYEVLHEVDIQTEGGVPGYYSRVEGWLLPADGRARLITTWGYKRSPFVSEWIITASGRKFTRVCLDRCRPASFIHGRSGWADEGHVPAGFGGSPETVPGTFAQEFRAAYRAHAVVADGTTTFDGKRVARVATVTALLGQTSIFWRPGSPAPVSIRRDHSLFALIDWYIDPATARPVGLSTWACPGSLTRSCERPVGPGSITRIVTFQRLAPTPQNIALLTGPNAPAGAR